MPERLRTANAALVDIDLAAGAAKEADSPPSLLPSEVVDDVLRERPTDIAQLLDATLRAGLVVEEPEILPAAKPTRGRRPLSILTVSERVLYRSLVDALEPELPELDRTLTSFDRFKTAPLNDAHAAFVVMADVASCYQYIDHGVLRDELLSSTGSAVVTDALTELAGALSGQSFGLPQNRRASDVLAEIVLSLPERALIRNGYRLWRYNDDFRIAASTRAEAHAALESLEAQLREIGLTLNDEKTSIKPIDEYRQWSEAAERRLAEVQADVELDLVQFTDYNDEVPTDISHVEVETAIRLLELWEDDVRNQRFQFGPEAVVGRNLVRASLVALSRHQSERGLPYCAQILDHEPSLAPQVSLYLGALMPMEEDRVDQVLNDQIEDRTGYMSPWQALWLFQPLRQSSELYPVQVSWLRAHLNGRSDVVRAEAGTVLAFHGEVEADELARLFNVVKEASRPRLAAAIAYATRDVGNPLLRAVADERPLFRWVAESVLRE